MKKTIVLLSVLLLAVSVLLAFVFLPDNYPLKYREDISSAASANEVDAPLVAAIIYAESGFNKNAKSNKGALGLMQIMQQTAAWIAGELNADEYDLFNAKTNISFGCFYLRYLKDKFETEIEVLCAYNAGEAKVREWQEIYGEITQENIPFSETREYVKKVLKAKKYYAKKFG